MRTLINIDVPDLTAAIIFYSTALGLQMTRMLDDDVAELSGASATIYLLQKDSGTPVSAPTFNTESGAPFDSQFDTRHYARHWTPVHLDFVVDDLDAAKQKALDAGAICESECVEWRGSKCVTFADPFGHGFCLIAFVGASYS